MEVVNKLLNRDKKKKNLKSLPFDDKLFGENLAGFEIFQFRCGIEILNKLSEKELVKLIFASLNCSFKFFNFYLENFIIFIFIFIQYW